MDIDGWSRVARQIESSVCYAFEWKRGRQTHFRNKPTNKTKFVYMCVWFTGVLPVVAVYSANTVSEHSWWYLSKLSIKIIKENFGRPQQKALSRVLSTAARSLYDRKGRKRNVSTDITPAGAAAAATAAAFMRFYITMLSVVCNFILISNIVSIVSSLHVLLISFTKLIFLINNQNGTISTFQHISNFIWHKFVSGGAIGNYFFLAV